MCPFDFVIEDAPSSLQHELIDLQSNQNKIIISKNSHIITGVFTTTWSLIGNVCPPLTATRYQQCAVSGQPHRITAMLSSLHFSNTDLLYIYSNCSCAIRIRSFSFVLYATAHQIKMALLKKRKQDYFIIKFTLRYTNNVNVTHVTLKLRVIRRNAQL